MKKKSEKQKIKPVKAWGIVYEGSRELANYMFNDEVFFYRTKSSAKYNIRFNPDGYKVVKVEIRVIK